MKKTSIFIVIMTLMCAGPAHANELYDQLMEKLKSNDTQYQVDEFVNSHRGDVVSGEGYVCDVQEEKADPYGYKEDRFLVTINDNYQQYNIYCELSISMGVSKENQALVAGLKENTKVFFSGQLDSVSFKIIRLKGDTKIEVLGLPSA